MPTLPTLRALLIDEIKDLHSAETQLTKALPKMVKAATNPALKTSFAGHLEETRGHVSRLGEVLKILDLPAKGKTCHAMQGLVEEAAETIELTGPSSVRDAALIGAAQRVEHYEMAGYGTARAFAIALGENEIVSLLTATLDEEGAANEKLTLISLEVNAAALMADDEETVPAKARTGARASRD